MEDVRQKKEEEREEIENVNGGGGRDGEDKASGGKTGRAKGLGPRQRKATVETRRDREVMAFVARFRFMTVAALAERFGVSERRMRERVRRLESVGLARRPGSLSVPGGVYLTRRGTDLLGLPPRRPPRVDVHRRHELAIVAEVLRLERGAGASVQVLTERECRRLEADEVGTYHVDLRVEGRTVARWPDLVIVTPRRRVAVELEFTAKHIERTRRIVRGYLDSSVFDRVIYVVDSPALARQLMRLAGQQRAARLRLLSELAVPAVVRAEFEVEAWHAAPPAVIAAIRDAVAQTQLALSA